MRIDRLTLDAFGPFTDQVLDLQGGAPGGVHVIFGPNEAGKSTSLRAVTALLFGMPHRSVDAHLHPTNKLSISAQLSHEGQRLGVTRLKKRKDDLRDAEGNPLEQAVLDQLLGHVDEASFTQRFGLDQRELELGAEALLAGGEQGLFAAGTAGALARRVLEGLDADADGLFLPRGKNPELNQALANYQNAQRVLKQSIRPPDKWFEQKKAYDGAAREVRELKERRAAVRAEHTRLTRLASLLSDLGQLDQVEAELVGLDNVPRLRAGVTEERLEAQRNLRDAELAVARFDEDLRDTEQQLAEVPEPGSLADTEQEQLELRDRLGRARSAREDLPKLVARLRAAEHGVQKQLAGLGHVVELEGALERAQELMPSSAQQKRIQGLIADRASVAKELELATAAQAEAERQLSELDQRQVPEAGDVAPLQAALVEARAAQGKLAQLEELADQSARRAARRDRVGQRVGLQGSLSPEVEAAFAPDVVEDHARRWQELADELEQQRRHHQDEQRQLAEAEARLAKLLQVEDLPSEDRLLELRRARDAWLERAPQEHELPQLREAVEVADGEADRLRREASRVAERKALSLQVEGLSARCARFDEQLLALERQLGEHRTRVLAPLSELGSSAEGPAQLKRLARDLAEICALDHEERVEREIRGRLVGELEAAAAALRAGWGEPAIDTGELALPGLVRRAELELEARRGRSEAARAYATELERARRQQRESRERLVQAEARQAAWQELFDQAVVGLGQGLDAARAQDVLAELSELRDAVNEARGLAKRVEGISRDTGAFESEVARLVSRHAPDLEGSDAIDAAEALLERIFAAHRQRQERERLQAAREQQRERRRSATAALKSAQATLVGLLQEAQVSEVDQLPVVEERSKRAAALDADRARLEKTLREKSFGHPLGELRQQAAGVSHNQLASQIDDLAEEQEELEDKLRRAESEATSLQVGLESYRSEDVAVARQRVADRSSAARALLRRYVTVRTAQVALRRQMSEYAHRFAGPVAHKASELFQRLTLGRYERLSIGVGENTIRMVRGQQEVEVDALSRGTRAQLYFALRLASLITHFESERVIPLVFDDLLVDFDDDRATAAFEILGDLAQRVQILYFTHLGRDVEAAQNGVPAGLLFQHRLGLR